MNRIIIGRAVLLACIAFSLWKGLQFAFHGDFPPLAIDYKVFWKAAYKPIDLLYVTGGNDPFVYPPTALIFFKPLALFDFIPGFIVWTILSLSAFLFAVRRAAGLLVAIASGTSFSAISCALMGQTSLILGAAVVAAFTLPSFVCGAIIGVVLTIKPQMIFLAPLAFLIRRDWLAIQGLLAAMVVIVAAELVLFGPSLWIEWLNAIPHFNATIERLNILRFVVTPFGMAEARGLPGLPFLILGVIIASGTLGASRRMDGVNLAATVSAASLLASPYALPHDMTAIVPACIDFILTRPAWSIPAIGIFTSIWPGLALLSAPIHPHLYRQSRSGAGHSKRDEGE